MRVAVGSDHRGFEVKQLLLDIIPALGHVVVDQGTDSRDSVDYPDIAAKVSRLVCTHEVDRGILICGTGIGMSIAANKFLGIRAAICNDAVTAEISRRHNDLNVLCLSGDLLGQRNIESIIKVWLETEFEGGRHARRIKKVAQLEQEPRCC